MRFEEQMQQYQLTTELYIDSYLTVPELPEKRLYEAMQYSAGSGGKRIRPVLSLAVADLLGVSVKKVLPYACALEMIHAYSLIHDDLPAMDNDDLRRGKPTNHIVFGEALAILAGDALLNGAYELMLQQALSDPEPRCALNAIALVANAAGAKGMIAGQVMDIDSEEQQIAFSTLQRLHQLKTGALIRAAILLPAELIVSEQHVRKALEHFADAIGIAFQIKDDLLDVESTTDVLGKPVGSDEKNHKSTYVQHLGKAGALLELNRMIVSAIDALSIFGEKADFLRTFAQFFGSRSK